MDAQREIARRRAWGCAALAAAACLFSGPVGWLPFAAPSFAALRPFGPLFVLTALLAALHARQRRAGRDLPASPDAPPQWAQATPIVLAVVGEKWIAVELLGRVAARTARDSGPAFADPVYRLATGGALLLAALLALPLPRAARPEIRAGLSPAAALRALAISGAAATVLALALVAVSLVVRAPWTIYWAPSFRVAAAAQVVRGFAEELFYRAALQGALAALFARLPWRRGERLPRRAAAAGAILVVSCGFALQHLDARRPPAVAAGALLFVLLTSILLGMLYAAARNLYLAAAAHTALNLLLLRALPLPVNATGEPLLAPARVGLLFVFLLFVGAAVDHRRRRGKSEA